MEEARTSGLASGKHVEAGGGLERRGDAGHGAVDFGGVSSVRKNTKKRGVWRRGGELGT
jgi:hypothetical protein